MSRPALTRLLSLELGTEVEVLEASGPVDDVDLRVQCTSTTVYLSIEPSATEGQTEQTTRILPSRALAGREGERLLALTIAELVAASSIERAPKAATAPPPPATGTSETSPPSPAEVVENAPNAPPEPPTPAPRSVPAPSDDLDLATRLGASAVLLAIPLRHGPTWYGARVWAARDLGSSLAIEIAGSYAVADERSAVGNVESQLVSAHAFLRYLPHVGDVILDIGFGATLAYMQFTGTPDNSEALTTNQQFVNGGPSIQVRVTTDTSPFFAGITLEAAAILQPVDITGETDRGTDRIELVVASVRGVWLGLAFDLGAAF